MFDFIRLFFDKGNDTRKRPHAVGLNSKNIYYIENTNAFKKFTREVEIDTKIECKDACKEKKEIKQVCDDVIKIIKTIPVRQTWLWKIREYVIKDCPKFKNTDGRNAEVKWTDIFNEEHGIESQQNSVNLAEHYSSTTKFTIFRYAFASFHYRYKHREEIYGDRENTESLSKKFKKELEDVLKVGGYSLYNIGNSDSEQQIIFEPEDILWVSLLEKNLYDYYYKKDNKNNEELNYYEKCCVIINDGIEEYNNNHEGEDKIKPLRTKAERPWKPETIERKKREKGKKEANK